MHQLANVCQSTERKASPLRLISERKLIIRDELDGTLFRE
jgi:hypothetical protein